MIRLRVFGVPAPQGSKSAIVVGGKARVIEGKGTKGREAVKEWRRAVADAAREALGDEDARSITGACRVSVSFYFVRPASVSVKKRPHHTVKPDIDKLLRATLDALTTSGLLAGDQLVMEVSARKCYVGDGIGPGALIDITTIEEDDQ